MSSPAPFEPITELLERGVSIHNVYGEPVHNGDKTVIPVAQVAFGFGAGGGRGPGRAHRKGSQPQPDGAPKEETAEDAQGAGGGGGVRLNPVGALEIGPDGTRFIRFSAVAPMVGVGALGLALGWLLTRRHN